MKFKKKPVTVDAERFYPKRKPWPQGVVESFDHMNGMAPVGWGIHTLEGFMEVNPGDWVVTGVEGERYAVKPSIFKKTYVKV
jgi:hypothetical protein